MVGQTVPRKADAVVIGGGVVGAAMLFALVEQGLRDVVLLERDRLGCGTTWHSAANIALIDVSARAYMDFYDYNMELFERLGRETGQEVGWRKTGRVQMATNAARVAALKHTQAVARARGFESTWIGPDEIRERLPILRVDDLIGGLWTPTVGRVNATDFIAALSKSARARGAMVLEGTPVRGIGLDGGAVCAVETDRGTIETTRVVNCAGLWAPTIARMVGADLPIYANEHFYILTKPFDGVFKDMPSFRDSDACIYGREEVGGLLLGCFEARAKPIAVEALPEDFSFGLLPDDWEQFEPYMVAAVHRIPALDTAEVKILLNGPESFTPDGRFLAGPIPGVRGFHVLAGMNSAGVNHAAGSARALAELMLDRPSRIDLSAFSPSRFAAFHSRPGWLRERVSEAPGHLYSVGRTHREFRTGRNLRLSPLHARLDALGAEWRAVMGWERAVAVSGLEAELEALRAGVGIADWTSSARFKLQGAGSEEIVRRRFGGLALRPGECEVALAPSNAGGVETALLVARLAQDRFLLVGEAERQTADRILLEPGAGEEGQVLELHSAMAALRLEGVRAEDAVVAAFGRSLPEGGAGTMPMDGAEVTVLRHPWTGACWLLVDSDCANYVAERIFSAAVNLDMRWVGERALDVERSRHRVPALGHELVVSLPPSRCGLEEWGEGRYRLSDAAGLLRGKVRGDLKGGEPVFADSVCVGFVTSAAAPVDGACDFLAPVESSAGSISVDLEGALLPVDRA